jgi:hypothetical protein
MTKTPTPQRAQGFHPGERLGDADAAEHQMHALHQHRVACHQRLAIAPEKLTATHVVRIAATRQSQPGSGIHENHGRVPHLAKKSSCCL